jgi:hypothetical protein
MNKSLLAFLVILTACNDQATTFATKQQTQTLSLDSASKVYMNIVTAKPYFIASFIDTTSQPFIVGFQEKSGIIPNYVLTKIESRNNNWQKVNEVTLAEEEAVEILDTIKTEKIENKDYLYVSTKQYVPGTGAAGFASIVFYAIDPASLTRHSLVYSGELVNEDQVSGEYYYDSSLNKNNALKRYLEEKAQTSKYVYKKTAADFDLNNPKNFEKKFLIDNPEIQESRYRNQEKLNVTYYDDDLPRIVGSSVDTVENKDYKIFSLFRFGVVGFDKKKKRFFPIYIDKCNNGCDLTASLGVGNILDIVYDLGDRLKFDLDKFTYSRETKRRH